MGAFNVNVGKRKSNEMGKEKAIWYWGEKQKMK